MFRRILILLLVLMLVALFPACGRADDTFAISFDDGRPLPEHAGSAEIPPLPLVSMDVIQEKAANPPVNYTDFKAVWLSQYDLMDVFTANGTQRSAADFAQYATKIFQNILQSGFNTVILQVRPNGDSFYPSSLYPASRYVTGGYERSFTYDPLAILIEKAHEQGLSVHAWINPLRCMSSENLLKIDDRYPIYDWYHASDPPDRIVEVDSLLYLNPAYPEVRELIVAGAREILETYPVDGLHMDDYFYPTTAQSFDQTSYDAYLAAGGTLSLSDFRRDNLNLLVAELYALTKAVHPDLLFTISPAGNLDRVYHSHYADVFTWCSTEGYLDAIIPQIYFGMEHETHPFDATLTEWADIVTCDSIRLFCGMTLEKAASEVDPYAGSGKEEWAQQKDVLYRSLSAVQKEEKCRGLVCFSYQYFYDPLNGKPVTATQAELSTFLPLLRTIHFD